MTCQVPSVEPSSTRINSNVMPVASSTSAIARCRAGILPASFIAGMTTLNRGPPPCSSLTLSSGDRSSLDRRQQRQSVVLIGDLSRGLLLQGATFLTGHALRLTRIMRSQRHSHQNRRPGRVKFQ